MSTTRTFQDMLNEYLPENMLKEEAMKRDYFLTNVPKDDGWKGGKLIVPFKAAGATSVKWGGLTDAADIAQAKYIRGSIDAYKEVWGSLIFNHTDLMQHDGKIKESTFLRILPDIVEDFMGYIKDVSSIQLLDGPHFAAVTDATNAATGIMLVDRVERFSLDQKCVIDDGDSAQMDLYVIAINMNTSAVTFSATRGGVAADISAYSVAQGAKFYHDGVWDGSTSIGFQSLKDGLLSAANGGSANLHGKSKLAYPYLQSININGSTISSTNILEKIFNGYAEIRQKAKGNANEILMSYKNFGSCMRALESQKGSFKVMPNTEQASVYGWSKIEIMAVASNARLSIVGIQECPDDSIFFIDWNALKFYSNGFFKKRTAPDGKQYYETRTTSGYAYILDVCLFGELAILRPGNCGIIHSISYAI